MKYQRLKTITGDGTIMRYFELAADTVACCNAFYGVTEGIATKIEGALPKGVTIVGFSHGGDRLAKGLILLDINPHVVYMAKLGEEDTDRPKIGEVVNGYQKVIDTHYDGDEDVSGKGTDPKEWGVEVYDNPYYLFTIEQPDGTEYAQEIDDSDAGEHAVPVDPGRDPEPTPEPTPDPDNP